MLASTPSFVEAVPRVERHVLDNGVVVYAEPAPQSRLAGVSLWIAAGSRCEPDDAVGSVHLLEHLMLRRGARGANTWHRMVEERGGSYGGATGREFLCFHYDAPASYALEPLPSFLDAMVGRPAAWDDATVEVEKSVVVEELAHTGQVPEDVLVDTLHAAVLRNELGRPAGGTVDEVRRLDAPAVLAVREALWTADRLGIVTTGVAPEALMDVLAGSAVSRMPAPSPSSIPDRVPAGPHPVPECPVPSDGDTPVLVGFAWPGFAVTDPKRAAAEVAVMMLAGSTASRLYREIREERGLAYGLDGWHSAYRDTGLQVVLVQTSAAKASEVVAIADAVVAAVREGVPPSAHEVEVARRRVFGLQFQEWEYGVERMFAIGRHQLVPGPAAPDFTAWARAVLDVSADDVVDVFRHWDRRQTMIQS